MKLNTRFLVALAILAALGETSAQAPKPPAQITDAMRASAANALASAAFRDQPTKDELDVLQKAYQFLRVHINSEAERAKLRDADEYFRRALNENTPDSSTSSYESQSGSKNGYSNNTAGKKGYANK
jgi:hypothetical protein